MLAQARPRLDGRVRLRFAPLSPVMALLLGATLWGVSWYPLRLLEAQGLYGIWLTLVVYAGAASVGLPALVRHRAELGRHMRTLLGMALAGGCTNIAFVLAVLDGNIMRVLLLFYLSPLWAVVLGWFVLGERISRLALLTLAVAMTGAVIMLWRPTLGIPWPATHADWLAIGAGLAFAVSNVIVRGTPQVSIAEKVMSTWCGVIALAAGLIWSFGVPAPSVTLPATLAALLLGAAGIACMTMLVQYGVTHMAIRRSAVILLFELVAGAVSQQLLSDEVMTLTEWVGGALIVLAAYLSAKL
jgi:drug/metabolite transporter (DMT)-like permease